MLNQSSWPETRIFEAVRNYNSSQSLIEAITLHQADINIRCKTLSNGVLHERNPLHLAIDEFMDAEVMRILIKFGSNCRSTMTEIKDGNCSSFDCRQRLESIRSSCNDPLTGEAAKMVHLEWCGRTFSHEWWESRVWAWELFWYFNLCVVSIREFWTLDCLVHNIP